MLRVLVVLVAIFSLLSSGHKTTKDYKCGKNETWYKNGVVDSICNRKWYVLPHKHYNAACGCKKGYRRGPKGCRLPGPDCT
ncbi:hypothetical protein GCK32_003913 [Trichostrongylus colubriformis]|uniref:Uncharacterized protein n=1 Tax=Trichostrongylus colubriformis TaxID=6319 RepID=A0AAN8F4S5_TRICO